MIAQAVAVKPGSTISVGPKLYTVLMNASGLIRLRDSDMEEQTISHAMLRSLGAFLVDNNGRAVAIC